MCYSPNIRVIKSRLGGVGWPCGTPIRVEKRIPVLVGKCNVNRPVGTSRLRWDDTIKIDIKDMA